MNTKMRNYRKQLPKKVKIVSVNNERNQEHVGNTYTPHYLTKDYDNELIYYVEETDMRFDITKCEPIWE